ncbi:Mitochondrial mRNA pseudouridine synthase Trub2 [Sergentomyia squamirostris]
MIIRNSATIFNALGGIMNVYKPAGVSVRKVINAIITNLCKDLNQLETRKPRSRLLFDKVDNETYNLEVVPDPADDIKVVGERHQFSDFKCQPAVSLGHFTSGVLLLGINRGTRTAYHIRMNRPVRVYRVTGRFGKATETHMFDSRIIAKSDFGHVSRGKLSGFLSSLQASHQRKMFELCGVDIQSETAYNLATQGTIRPANNNLPVIYGISLVDFKRPYFTLEIHALNEYEDYLATLIHEIGLGLQTVAHCTALRCIRCGYFTVDDSLLRGNWNLQHVISNLQVSSKILEDHPDITNQESISLVNSDTKEELFSATNLIEK